MSNDGSTDKRIVGDQPSEELLEIVSGELWRKIGKSTTRDLTLDLLSRFQGFMPAHSGISDAVSTGTYLRSILPHIEKLVLDLASGYSSTRWLWYLRRFPMFVFEGTLLTTYSYDSALAETASGLSRSAVDNLRVRGNSLRYATDGAVATRLLRFGQTIRVMSSVQRLLRYAGKGVSFKFSANDPFPTPVPTPEEERFITLYDKRMADGQRPLLRGGTTLFDNESEVGKGALAVYRIVPSWLPSVMRHRTDETQEVEVFSRFLPQIISFDRLGELNNDPRVIGREWVGQEAMAIVALLSVAPSIVGGLRYGLMSLMQFGYFVIADEALRRSLTELLPEVTEKLRSVFPGQPVPVSADVLIKSLENTNGSLWPLRPGPIIRRNEDRLWVDMYTANMLLDVLLEFPRTPGDAIANARADHFEDSVQRIIDASRWKPSVKDRQLLRRELRAEGKSISDVDALGTWQSTILLVSCKSVIYSGAYDTGDHQTVRNASATVQAGLIRWSEVVAMLRNRPVGDNYDVSKFDRFVPVLCTPFPVYVASGAAAQEVRPGLPAVVSLDELSSWLEKDS